MTQVTPKARQPREVPIGGEFVLSSSATDAVNLPPVPWIFSDTRTPAVRFVIDCGDLRTMRTT